MYKVSFLLLACVLICQNTIAQSPISQIIKNIIENNSEIYSQEQLLEVQRCDDADANSLVNPEVEFTRVWGKNGIGNKLQLDVSQSFDWPGLYRARSLSARQGQIIGQQEIRQKALELALEAKQKLIELIYVRKQLSLTDSIISNIEHLKTVVGKSLEHGEITIMDQKKTIFEAFKYKNLWAVLKNQESEICSDLQNMCIIPLNLNDIVQYPIENLKTEQEYIQEIDEDPAFMTQSLIYVQEGLNATVARQSRYPGFSLGFEHQAEMGDRFNGFTASMTLPFFENRRARQKALHLQDVAEMEKNNILAQSITNVKAQFEAIALWKKQIDDFRSVFGDNKYIRYIDKAYEAGQINVLEFIIEVNYYKEQSFTYLETEYNYYKSLAWLNRYQLLLQD